MKPHFLQTLNKHNPSISTSGTSNPSNALFKPKVRQQTTSDPNKTAKKPSICPAWAKIIDQYKSRMKDQEPETQYIEEPSEDQFEEFSIIIPQKRYEDRITNKPIIKGESSRRQSKYIKKTTKKPIWNQARSKIKPQREKDIGDNQNRWLEDDKTIPLNQSFDFSKDNEITIREEPTSRTRDKLEKQSIRLQRLHFIVNLANSQIQSQKSTNKIKMGKSSIKCPRESYYLEENEITLVNNRFEQEFLQDLNDLKEWQAAHNIQNSPINIEKKEFQLLPKLQKISFKVVLEEKNDQQQEKTQNNQFQKDKRQSRPPTQQQNESEQVQIIKVVPRPQSVLNQQTQKNDEKDIQFIKTNRVYPFQIGKASLKDLVQQIYYKHLINQQVYKQFVENHNIETIQDFLQKFYSGKLHHFNYQKFKITLLDHRRISELLTNLFPGDYYVGEVGNLNQEVQDFLSRMYAMSGQEYFKLCLKIDKISRIKWWNKILLAQEERLSSSYKEKKVNQKHAERADLAVKEVIESFLFKNNQIIEANSNFTPGNGQISQNPKDFGNKRQKLS